MLAAMRGHAETVSAIAACPSIDVNAVADSGFGAVLLGPKLQWGRFWPPLGWIQTCRAGLAAALLCTGLPATAATPSSASC